MNNIKYPIILIVIIVLWWIIFDSGNPKPINSIGGESVSKTTTEKINKQNRTHKTYNFSEDLANLPVLNPKPKLAPNLTYLQAYRNTVFFKKCYSVINDLNKNISPLIAFEKTISNDFYSIIKKIEKKATPLQLEYFSEFVDRCELFLENVNETHQSAKKRLNEHLYEIKPKTDEEKHLSKGIELFNQMQELNSNLRNSKYGSSSLDENELKNIKTEIRNYYKQIREYKANPDWKTNQQIQSIIKELNQNISNLRLTLSNSKIIDSNKIITIEEQLKQHKTKMVVFLKQNNSPDILLLYARTFFYPAGNNISNIAVEMRDKLQTYEPYFMLNLYNVGIKLAACAMNYPCDDKSDFINEYCIGLSSYLSPSACGKNLDDFYFNHYMGPNQLEDVSTYINYILDNYAKQ